MFVCLYETVCVHLFDVCMCPCVCACVLVSACGRCRCLHQVFPWLDFTPLLETGFHIYSEASWFEHTNYTINLKVLPVSGSQHCDLQACTTMCSMLQGCLMTKIRSSSLCSSHITTWHTMIFAFFLSKCVGGPRVYFLVVKKWYLEWKTFNKEDIL